MLKEEKEKTIAISHITLHIATKQLVDDSMRFPDIMIRNSINPK